MPMKTRSGVLRNEDLVAVKKFLCSLNERDFWAVRCSPLLSDALTEFQMPSAQEIRTRLESYSRAKVSSFLEGAIEELLVKQPIDPIEFLVHYLIQNRQDLRDIVANETLKVRE